LCLVRAGARAIAVKPVSGGRYGNCCQGKRVSECVSVSTNEREERERDSLREYGDKEQLSEDFDFARDIGDAIANAIDNRVGG
jgi:hypothetical protein